MITVKGLQIDDSRIRGVQGKTRCPNCALLGKKNLGMDLSVNKDKKLVNCHKCGWTGTWEEKTIREVKNYQIPDTANSTELKLEHLQSFSQRGITQKTVIRNGIKSFKGDWYGFIYYEGEIAVNIKYRNYKDKKFMQAKEAKPTMYKYNDIVGQKKIIICEGEFDALAWEEAGFLFATSVNQGAPNVKDENVEKKLECIYNCFDIFEEAEEIYLSVDNDPNGQRLQKELIRIFTAEKIKIIDHLDCKDANEVLLKYGKEKLIEIFNSSKEVKVDGIFECLDFEYEILNDYRNGQPKGTTTYFNLVDPHWKHRLGEVTIWTGYNNEGKSLLLKQLLLAKSKFDGWKHAVFSPEEMPLSEWYTDLIESYVGKSADKEQQKFGNYMTEMQLIDAANFMNKHFYSVYPTDEQTIEEILKKFSYLIRKKNIQTVVLDPYNQIQHMMQHGEREDLYISRFMAKLKRFAIDHNVAVHLVAHQVTPDFVKNENYPEPNIYKVKGGGTFADKADNVCIVWRENRNTDPKDTSVKFASKKIKKQKLTGLPGECYLNYNRKSNRYSENGIEPLGLEIEVYQTELNINQHIEPNKNFENESEYPF